MNELSTISDGGNFNPEQVEAIKGIDGVYLVAAPPGSGKTFVLQKRVIWMVKNYNIPTNQILAITFTNEAANEMKERIGNELKELDIENEAQITTFHSFALKILKQYSNKAGLSRRFSLIDENDQVKIMKNILKTYSFNIDNLDPRGALNIISRYKSSGTTFTEMKSQIEKRQEHIKAYVNDPELLESEGFDEYDLDVMKEIFNKDLELLKLYSAYEMVKEDAELYDFDDLILKLRDVLKVSQIRRSVSSGFSYVLIDETQDIDPVQEEIIRLLIKEKGNLFCIYDDDQSIYGFRNADPNLIMTLDQKLPNAKKLTLSENFRSTDSIIQAANHLISKNNLRTYKWMRTNNEKGETLNYKALQSKEAEAKWICTKIKELVNSSKYNYKDIAILYRNSELNKTIEQYLITEELPYKINKNISFFERKEIKDILAYLEFVVNDSEFHLERIINYPKRGVGEKIYNDFKKKSTEVGVGILDILGTSKNEKMAEFYELILECKAMIKNDKNLTEVIDYILEKTEYYEALKKELKKETELPKRQENIERLKQMLTRTYEEFQEPQEILYQIKLLSGDIEFGELTSRGKISLMTMHASKGMGFPIVFIIGCEQGIVPSYSAVETEEIEEERRLLYVAITRAKKECYITRSRYRLNYNGDLKETTISKFLTEIPEELLEWDEADTM